MASHDETTSPFDAYRPPPAPVAAEAVQPAGVPTGRIKTICVLAIVLGAIGLPSALMGIVGLTFGRQIQTAFLPATQTGVPKSLVEAQRAMQEDLLKIQDRFWAANIVLIGTHVVVASLLLVGGILCLRRVPPGRSVLLATCWLAIGFEVIRAGVQGALQMQTMSATMHHMQQMLQSTGGGQPEALDFAMAIARGSMIVGVVLGLGFVLLKLVYYGLAVRYLRQPWVREYLATPASAAPASYGLPT